MKNFQSILFIFFSLFILFTGCATSSDPLELEETSSSLPATQDSARTEPVVRIAENDKVPPPLQDTEYLGNLFRQKPHDAWKLFREGDNPARKVLARVLVDALRSEPDNERLQNLRGVFYMQLQEHRKARKAFEKVVQLNPEFAAGYLNLAAVHALQEEGRKAILNARISKRIYKQKNDPAGRARAEKMLELFYDSFGYKPEEFESPEDLEQATVKVGNGKTWTESVDQLHGAEAVGTDDLQAKAATLINDTPGANRTGVSISAYEEEALLRKQVVILKEATAVKPDDPELYFILGSKHYTLGRFLEKRSQGFWPSKKRRMDYEEAVNHYEEAIKNLQETLRIIPASAGAHFNLALIFFVKDDVKQAIIHMQEARRLFTVLNDDRGFAKSNKTLREWYDEYGFKEDDFK